jgi:predicted nucleotidyltransferase
MVTDNETINKIIQQYIADVRKNMPIDKVYLYGSYAKGTQTEHSDIDICFFSRDFENQPTIDIIMQLFRLTRKYKGFDIQPTAFTVSDMSNDNPFVKEILRTGREIIV